MVSLSNRDVRLHQIRNGDVEPRRPSETIEAQVPWLALAGGSLIGLGANDLPVVGGWFDGGGGGGGGLGIQTIVLLVLVVVALLVLTGTIALSA